MFALSAASAPAGIFISSLSNSGTAGCPVRGTTPFLTDKVNVFRGTLGSAPFDPKLGKVLRTFGRVKRIVNGTEALEITTPTCVPPKADTA
jgi:hypothetical protein